MKVLGVKQFHQKTFTFLDLSGSPMQGILGKLSKQFVMTVKGYSGNGKTEFNIRLAKELCKHGKVAYIHYEQGHGADFQMATLRNNMEEVSGNFYPIDPWEKITEGNTVLDDLDAYLKKRSSADYIFIDSLDDSGFKIPDYQYLKRKYGKKKAFIFISRSTKSGGLRAGSVNDYIAFDGQITVFVKDYIAHPEKNRLGGIDPYIIWEQEAKKRNPMFFAKRDELRTPAKPTKKTTRKTRSNKNKKS